MKISFTVNDIPQPGGSKKAFMNPKTNRIVVTEDCAANAGWRASVIYSAKLAKAAGGLTADHRMYGPLCLTIRFYMRRPGGHYGTGKNAGKVKKNAPVYHTTRPDLTKLTRSTEDALTLAGIWGDDSQVAVQILHKLYAATSFAEIEIEEIEITPQKPKEKTHEN